MIKKNPNVANIDLSSLPSEMLRAELLRRERESDEATPEENAAYDRLCFWRGAWLKLANKRVPNRLQSKQERIERRSQIANIKIGKLMRDYDARVGIPRKNSPGKDYDQK